MFVMLKHLFFLENILQLHLKTIKNKTYSTESPLRETLFMYKKERTIDIVKGNECSL